MSKIGQMRMPPDEVGRFIQRPPSGGVANAMIAFIAGHGPIALALAPYFVKREPIPATSQAPSHTKSLPRLGLGVSTKWAKRIGVWSLICIIANGITAAISSMMNPVMSLQFGLGYFSFVFIPMQWMGVPPETLPLWFSTVVSFIILIALIWLQWKGNQRGRPVEAAILVFLLINVPMISWLATIGMSPAVLWSEFFKWGVGFYLLSIPSLVAG